MDVPTERAQIVPSPPPPPAGIDKAIERAPPEVASVVALGSKLVDFLMEQQRADREAAREQAERDLRERESDRQHELELWSRREFPTMKLGVLVLVIVILIGSVLAALGIALGPVMVASAMTALIGAGAFMAHGSKLNREAHKAFPSSKEDED